MKRKWKILIFFRNKIKLCSYSKFDFTYPLFKSITAVRLQDVVVDPNQDYFFFLEWGGGGHFGFNGSTVVSASTDPIESGTDSDRW
jgi:hypothetical protein